MIEAEQQQVESEKKKKELAQAYKRLFRTDDGKIVKEDLERFCGFNNISVSEQDPNAYQTFFAEGKRRVYLRIIGMINRREIKEKK